ncbi:MAG: DUF4954 family protein [Planctomycetota bacterium]|jgi:hypothetical protein
MPSDYRALTSEEINQLTSQGCSCDNWAEVLVVDGFDAARIKSAHFSGQVKLGRFDSKVLFGGNITRPTGISDSMIHNCIIGDNVYINHVKSYIANYKIEDNAVIENIDLLAVEGESSFGNGTEVTVLNEAGGREIPIYDNLSAHTAYIIALYCHRKKVIEKIKEMIADYISTVSSSMGIVGKGARIINCRIIKNVKVGPDSKIEGVEKLENGSVNSSSEDPVYIGPAVIAEDFIVCSGSTITDGTIISKCFIGQGCELAKQYSAENSVFFANCGGYHGEACSIFAGPYTVTHHKSTLLIAGLFSFLNAGSGSNQSNHMYKLGPVHQGIVERGSKTTSDSYILWPAKIGAFTVVMGRHYKNSDTSDLPFSYLVEHKDESILVPGENLRKVGTVRDAGKWPKRDKRKDSKKLDHINFNLLSPYTIQKMINGCEVLTKLKESSGKTSDYFTYHSVRIKNSSLIKGILLYEIGIDKFLGNSLISRLEKREFKTNKEIQDRLKPDTKTGLGKWIDMAGLITPEQIAEKLLKDIEDGTVNTLAKIQKAFESLNENYYRYEWTWAIDVLQERLGKKINQITARDVIEVVNIWKEAVIKLDNMLYEDTKKEFSPLAQTGYGIDGDSKTKQADFEAVRDKLEDNPFAQEIKKHIETKTELGNELVKRMEKVG